MPAARSLRVQLLSEHARLPTRASALAAGYDLYAAHGLSIPPRGKGVVRTDIAVGLPAGTYGRVAPRSGLAVKKFVDVGAGVIDQDYRGNVAVVLFNFAEEPFDVRPGDRVAQLVLERIATPDVVSVERLDETKRGAAGFGSTDVKKPKLVQV